MGSGCKELERQIRACKLCEAKLPEGARPVFQFHSSARILIAGQAPGNKVHHSGVPFDDASGERLRAWLGIDRETFYDSKRLAILPMAFCYPGRGKSGDLPPLPECATQWRSALMAHLKALKLTVIVGQYALQWHAPESATRVTAAVALWRQFLPERIVLPHPSPRNNIWLKKNPWFESEVIPPLQKRVQNILDRG